MGGNGLHMKKSLIPLSIILLAVCVSAVRLPDLFIGTTYIDGAIALANTSIVIKSHETGEWVGRGFVLENGLTRAEIFFDNDFEPGVDEGAEPGEAVDFYVGDYLCNEPAPGSIKAKSGEYHPDTVFRVSTSQRPPKTPSSSGGLIILLVGLILAVLFYGLVFISIRRIHKS